MNLLVLEEREKLHGNYYELDERKSSHIIQILKLNPTDSLNAGVLDKEYGIFEIGKIENGVVTGMFLQTACKEKQENFPEIRLFSSIQRPQTVKKILQLASSFGLTEIYFFIAEKAERSYLNSPIWQKENLTKEIVLGLEQGKNIFSPKVTIIKNKKDISQISAQDLKLLFHPNGKPMNFFKDQIQSAKSISILIGPESGFREAEVGFFQEMGFQASALSKSILRSETAFTYAVAQIELLVSAS